MTLIRPQHELPSDLDAEALIKEARRLRRRRWAIGSALVLLAGLILGLALIVHESV